MSRRANDDRKNATAPAGAGRRRLDAAAVSAAFDRQRAVDRANPPAAQMTLMDAVRLVAPLILERRASKWTAPQIVALLDTSLGVTISAETLRVYLHRIKRESGVADEPTQAPGQPEQVMPTPVESTTAEPVQKLASSIGVVGNAGAAHAPAPSPLPVSPAAAPAPVTPSAEDDQPSRFNPLVDLDEDI